MTSGRIPNQRTHRVLRPMLRETPLLPPRNDIDERLAVVVVERFGGVDAPRLLNMLGLKR